MGQTTREGIVRSASLMSLATMASRLLGLVREQFFAFLFGAGLATDAFNVAFRIPNLLRDLFAEGAMSSAFVPTLTKTMTRDGLSAALRLANLVIHALLVVVSLIVIAGLVWSEEIINLYASSFGEVPGKLALTVLLTRIMMPFLLLVAFAAAAMGCLNARGRFFVPAIAPAMFNFTKWTIEIDTEDKSGFSIRVAESAEKPQTLRISATGFAHTLAERALGNLDQTTEQVSDSEFLMVRRYLD